MAIDQNQGDYGKGLILLGVVILFLLGILSRPLMLTVTGSVNKGGEDTEISDEDIDTMFGEGTAEQLGKDGKAEIETAAGETIVVTGHSVNHLSGSKSNRYTASEISEGVTKCIGDGIANSPTLYVQNNSNNDLLRCGRFFVVVKCIGQGVWEVVTFFGERNITRADRYVRMNTNNDTPNRCGG